ncbi:MAG: flagellar motor switch protein FliN [Desulfobacteraceae bacterium]|jgi:flagellar motor switch protein FliN/FliY
MATPENDQTIENQGDIPNDGQVQVGEGLAEGSNAGNTSSNEDAYAFNRLSANSDERHPANLDFILDIPLEITVELGRTKMLIHDLLKLGQGSVIELPKAAGETLEILANNRLIAKGDVVVMNDKYGIRLTEVISTVERLENLK